MKIEVTAKTEYTLKIGGRVVDWKDPKNHARIAEVLSDSKSFDAFAQAAHGDSLFHILGSLGHEAQQKILSVRNPHEGGAIEELCDHGRGEETMQLIMKLPREGQVQVLSTPIAVQALAHHQVGGQADRICELIRTFDRSERQRILQAPLAVWGLTDGRRKMPVIDFIENIDPAGQQDILAQGGAIKGLCEDQACKGRVVSLIESFDAPGRQKVLSGYKAVESLVGHELSKETADWIESLDKSGRKAVLATDGVVSFLAKNHANQILEWLEALDKDGRQAVLTREGAVRELPRCGHPEVCRTRSARTLALIQSLDPSGQLAVLTVPEALSFFSEETSLQIVEMIQSFQAAERAVILKSKGAAEGLIYENAARQVADIIAGLDKAEQLAILQISPIADQLIIRGQANKIFAILQGLSPSARRKILDLEDVTQDLIRKVPDADTVRQWAKQGKDVAVAARAAAGRRNAR